MIGSGEGGGGGPTDVGVWGRVRKVNKIARLKGQVWELISLETSRAPTNMVTKTFCAVLCIPWTGGKSHTTTTPHHRSSAGQNSIPVVFCDIWRRNSLQLMTASWGHLGCGLMSSANQEAELQNLIRNTARIMKNNHENCLLTELKTNFF